MAPPTTPTNPAVAAALAKAKAATTNTPAVAIQRKILTPDEIMQQLDNVPSLMETKNDEVEHVILYGAPGTAKTTQAGLLAEFFNILWFDGDKGLTALIHNLHPELLKRIRVIKIPDNTAHPVMVDTMLRVITGRQVAICMEHGIVECIPCKRENKLITIALNSLPKNWVVVMDSQTQMVASAMTAVHYKINPSAKKDGDIDHFWRGTGDDVFAYWSGLKNIMDKFGSYVKDLECQFVTISHEALVEMEDKSKEIAPVSGSDNSSRSYAKYYGTEIHCDKVNNRIMFSSSATASNTKQSKSRTNVALEKEPIPALLHIFRPDEAPELLKGSYTEWYFKEGWKPKKDRTTQPPQPKGVLPA